MVRLIFLFTFAILFIWLSCQQVMEIVQTGSLRLKGGYLLTDWTMYVAAGLPALLGLLAIWTGTRKRNNKPTKGA